MLLFSFFMCISKGNEYYQLIFKSEQSPEYELAIDLKIKMNKVARDFYIMVLYGYTYGE